MGRKEKAEQEGRMERIRMTAVDLTDKMIAYRKLYRIDTTNEMTQYIKEKLEE